MSSTAVAANATAGIAPNTNLTRKDLAVQDLKKRLKDHANVDQQLKDRKWSAEFIFFNYFKLLLLGRVKLKELMKEFHQSEQDIKALQTVGQMIGEVIKALDEEKCNI